MYIVHAAHVSTSCPIMCIVQTSIAQGGGGDPQWMWTSRKKRLNTLNATRRKKSWTTRDEAHTGRTWRYGSRVVGSDVTWRDSKHVTHCPYVTLWHHSLVDKCLGSNVTWYLIRTEKFETLCWIRLSNQTKVLILKAFLEDIFLSFLVLMPSGIFIYILRICKETRLDITSVRDILIYDVEVDFFQSNQC